MMRWAERTLEERVLLNPAFCASLLWHFAAAGGKNGLRSLTLAESFLVLPIVLPRVTREALPRSTRTSLAVWLDENSSFQATLAVRAKALMPFSRDALIFGGTRQFIRLSHDLVHADLSWRRRASAAARQASEETQACAKRAAFLGAWFAESGSASTVMALIGVRP